MTARKRPVAEEAPVEAETMDQVAVVEPKQPVEAAPRFRLWLSFEQVASIATVLVAASKDDVTPVITNIHLKVEGRKVVASATDRYRIARVTFEAGEDSAGAGEVLLSPTLLLSALSAAKLREQHKNGLQSMATVTLTVAEDKERGEVTVIDSPIWGWRFDERPPAGNYPPLDRLFPDGSERKVGPLSESTRIDMNRLAEAAKVRVPGQVNPPKTDNVWEIVQIQQPNGAGPILFTQTSDTGVAEYLLQPNVKLR